MIAISQLSLNHRTGICQNCISSRHGLSAMCGILFLPLGTVGAFLALRYCFTVFQTVRSVRTDTRRMESDRDPRGPQLLVVCTWGLSHRREGLVDVIFLRLFQ